MDLGARPSGEFEERVAVRLDSGIRRYLDGAFKLADENGELQLVEGGDAVRVDEAEAMGIRAGERDGKLRREVVGIEQLGFDMAIF